MMRSLKSRQGLLLVSQGLAMAFIVGSAARCSSTSGGNVVPAGDDGGGNKSSSGTSSGTSSGVSDAAPPDIVEAGADGGCAGMATLTEAAKITFPVGWPMSTAGNPGSGNVSIWLLTKFNVAGTALTGTSQSCALSLPDLALN